jgi:hypothetical protein
MRRRVRGPERNAKSPANVYSRVGKEPSPTALRSPLPQLGRVVAIGHLAVPLPEESHGARGHTQKTTVLSKGREGRDGAPDICLPSPVELVTFLVTGKGDRGKEAGNRERR